MLSSNKLESNVLSFSCFLWGFNCFCSKYIILVSQKQPKQFLIKVIFFHYIHSFWQIAQMPTATVFCNSHVSCPLSGEYHSKSLPGKVLFYSSRSPLKHKLYREPFSASATWRSTSHTNPPLHPTALSCFQALNITLETLLVCCPVWSRSSLPEHSGSGAWVLIHLLHPVPRCSINICLTTSSTQMLNEHLLKSITQGLPCCLR